MLDPDKTCAVFISVVCNYTLYCLHWFHLVGAAAGKRVSTVTWCAPATQVFCTQFRPFPCWPQTLSPRTPPQLPSESFAEADCAWLHFWSPFRNPHVSFSHHNCGQSESGLLAGRPGITCTPDGLRLDWRLLWPDFSWVLGSLHFWGHENVNSLRFLPRHPFFHIILVTCGHSFECINLTHSFSTK